MTWSRLLSLCAAAKRPLVVLDFETAGLGGAPPVSFAVQVYHPTDEAQIDTLSDEVCRRAPPGLVYAAASLLDPGVPIDPEARAVHGIADEDVRGKATHYQDIEVRGFFQGLATGDGASGPAVFVGHNIAAADAPWAARWGLLPEDIDLIDTMRLARRLASECPMPPVVDALSCSPSSCPAAALGLDVFSSSLGAVHAGLFGERPEKLHSALVDVTITARVLARMLDGWSPLFPVQDASRSAEVSLASYLAALDVPPPKMVSWDGWLKGPVGAALTWSKGKHRGRPVTADLGYARWVLGLPRGPTGDDEAWCSDLTASLVERQLKR